MPKAPGFIEFEVIGWDELATKFKNGREYMYGAVITAFRRIGRVLVNTLKSETPVGATGHLRNYTVFQLFGKTEDLRMEVRQSAVSDDGFFYGVAVRTGTKPHFPPYKKLIPWVMRKLGISNEKEATRVAFLVARKISKVGTKSNPYHERTLNREQVTISNIMTEEMVNLLTRLSN
jgi:hypothetical protein